MFPYEGDVIQDGVLIPEGSVIEEYPSGISVQPGYSGDGEEVVPSFSLPPAPAPADQTGTRSPLWLPPQGNRQGAIERKGEMARQRIVGRAIRLRKIFRPAGGFSHRKSASATSSGEERSQTAFKTNPPTTTLDPAVESPASQPAGTRQ